MQLTCINLQNLTSISKAHIRLLEAVIQLWRETYTPILAAAKEQLSMDDFFSAKAALVLHEGDQPVGFCVLNSRPLGLSGVRDCRYFAPLPPKILEDLERTREALLSIEWVTVHPEHRAKLRKVQIADLVMGAAFRLFHQTSHTVVIGYSRTDVGADRIAMNFGVRGFEEISLHGINCRVMIGRKEWVGAHRFTVVESAIEGLWQGRNIVGHGFLQGADLLFAEQVKHAA